ncbi:hypothetical protein B0H11DRAFT_1912851 [Mycena galericulata]|nr:hypothetical protein B0H11DRAFT_1912851 [Mycena galericulata]
MAPVTDARSVGNIDQDLLIVCNANDFGRIEKWPNMKRVWGRTKTILSQCMVLEVWIAARWGGGGGNERETMRTGPLRISRVTDQGLRPSRVGNTLIADFLVIPLQDLLNDDSPFPGRSSWFSPDPPTCGEDTVWSLASIPPLDFVRQLESHFPQAWLNGSQSIVDHTNVTRRLPLQTPTFFREINTLRASQEKWRESYDWLPQTKKYLLDFVEWNSKHTDAPEGQRKFYCHLWHRRRAVKGAWSACGPERPPGSLLLTGPRLLHLHLGMPQLRAHSEPKPIAIVLGEECARREEAVGAKALGQDVEAVLL